MARPELYVSIDIETDGPAPGINSMLALGAAVFTEDADDHVDTFYATMRPAGHTSQNVDTMAWWATQPEAWAEVTASPQHPGDATRNFVTWCEGMMAFGRLVTVGWPIAFDFAFVNYYCHRYANRNPLGFGGLDIRSYANGLAGHPDYYGIPEKQVRAMAGEIDKTGLRPHVAVDDAIEQGRLFMALRKHALSRQ